MPMTGAAAQVVAVLERHLGLAHGSVGERVLAAALRRRMDATGVSDAAAYLTRVTNSRQELDELVEAVIVPETWFFRYPESFRHMAAWATERRGQLPPGRQLRVLSIPCCTGEEPFSIVVSLLNAGFLPGSFRVDALDVSRRAVEFARGGVYGATAFRDSGADLTDFRDRYFNPVKDGFAVGDDVRRPVTFRVANLADPEFLAGEQPYDVIFCRNLFIYLTEDARKTAIASLDRLLTPGGIIYMGHAEPLGLMDARFKAVTRSQAFAFVRADADQPLGGRPGSNGVLTPEPAAGPFPGLKLNLPLSAPPTPAPGGAAFTTPVFTAPIFTTPAPVAPAAAPAAVLDQARLAADRGQVADAIVLCEQSIRDRGSTADALALLGVLRTMTGDRAEAERCFGRALYLDPGHYDALIHMMVLAQNRGDATAAANFRRRADQAGRLGGRP